MCAGKYDAVSAVKSASEAAGKAGSCLGRCLGTEAHRPPSSAPSSAPSVPWFIELAAGGGGPRLLVLAQHANFSRSLLFSAQSPGWQHSKMLKEKDI